MDACDVLIDCGCTKPLAQIKISDVPYLVKSVALHSTVLKRKAELDQFMDGLEEAGVLPSIKLYPNLFESLFVKPNTLSVTAGGYDTCTHNNLLQIC